MVSETRRIIFLVSRGETPNTCHLISEPAEHKFGLAGAIIWEQIVN